jgi:hypothetical protein
MVLRGRRVSVRAGVRRAGDAAIDSPTAPECSEDPPLNRPAGQQYPAKRVSGFIDLLLL